MNQAVRTPGEVHQVLAKLRVSGDDHRVTRGIDAISKCWVHSSMIDEERGGSRRTVIIYFILLYFFRIDFDAFSWKGIRRGLTNANIKGKCLSKVLRHTGSSLGPQIRSGLLRPKNHPESHKSGIPTTW